MKYCSQCGAELQLLVPAGDNRLRHVCAQCQTIHYQNPKIVAGCIPELDGQILLCRRAIEPRAGLWTLPAGFMENGETTLEAAIRETLEEANARVRVDALYALFNLPHIDQVYFMFRCRLLDKDFSPGEESLEVRLFDEEEIPWADLAFATIRHTLEFYFCDRARNEFPLRMGDIVLEQGRYVGFTEQPSSTE